MSEKVKKSPEEAKANRQAAVARARAAKAAKRASQQEQKGETEVKNLRLIHAFEMLDAIEKATGEKKVALLKEYGTKSPLNFLLSLNYRSDIKLEIPEGMPPSIKPEEIDLVSHPDTQGMLSSSIARLLKCRVEVKDVPKFKKEKLFIDVMLACPWKDAEILCFCKDRAIVELYPSITKELVQSVFPAYVK